MADPDYNPDAKMPATSLTAAVGGTDTGGTTTQTKREPKPYDAAVEQAATRFEQQQGKAEELLTKSYERLSGMQPPKLPPIPQEPAPPEQQGGLHAWGSVAMMFAMFASLATRSPFTTALNAAASVMNAYNVGDRVRAQDSLERWKVASQNAMKMAQWERDQYKDELDSEKSKVEIAKALMPKMNALRDEVPLLMIKAGRVDDAIEFLRNRGRAASQLDPMKAQQGFNEQEAYVDWVRTHPNATAAERNTALSNIRKGLSPDGKEPKELASEKKGRDAAKVLSQLSSGQTVRIGGITLTKDDLDKYNPTNIATAKDQAIHQLIQEAAGAPDSAEIMAKTDEGSGEAGGSSASPAQWPVANPTEGMVRRIPDGYAHAGELVRWDGSHWNKVDESQSESQREGAAQLVPGL